MIRTHGSSRAYISVIIGGKVTTWCLKVNRVYQRAFAVFDYPGVIWPWPCVYGARLNRNRRFLCIQTRQFVLLL